MNIIFLDSELELKKGETRKKNWSGLIWDQNYDWKKLKSKKRGRPDIVHFSLLLCQDSLLNMEGKLKVFIHTRDGDIIHIDPKTSPPRSLERFKGIMAKLLLEGEINSGEGKRLFWTEKKDIKEFINELGSEVIIMSENGESAKGCDFSDKTVIIGGFPSGGFKTKVFGRKVKVSKSPLSAWTITSYVLNH